MPLPPQTPSISANFDREAKEAEMEERAASLASAREHWEAKWAEIEASGANVRAGGNKENRMLERQATQASNLAAREVAQAAREANVSGLESNR